MARDTVTRNSDWKRFDTRQWALDYVATYGKSRPGRIIADAFGGRDLVRTGELWEDNVERLATSVAVFYEARHNQQRIKSEQYPGEFGGEHLFPLIDDFEGKSVLRNAAASYVLTPSLHCRRFAIDALTVVLDTELYPLIRELTSPADRAMMLSSNGLLGVVGGMVPSLSPGWQVMLALLGVVARLGVLLLAVFLWFSDDTAWSVVLIVGLGAVTYRQVMRRRAIRSLLLRLSNLRVKLQMVRDEVAEDGFSAVRIGERLRDAESAGAYVPSVAYELLSLIQRLPLDDEL